MANKTCHHFHTIHVDIWSRMIFRQHNSHTLNILWARGNLGLFKSASWYWKFAICPMPSASDPIHVNEGQIYTPQQMTEWHKPIRKRCRPFVTKSFDRSFDLFYDQMWRFFYSDWFKSMWAKCCTQVERQIEKQSYDCNLLRPVTPFTNVH